jgi:PAS domain-containing protein
LIKFRQTEALRRKRTKSVVKGLKSLLGLKPSLDQTSVLEVAFEAVQELQYLKKQLSSGELVFTDPNLGAVSPLRPTSIPATLSTLNLDLGLSPALQNFDDDISTSFSSTESTLSDSEIVSGLDLEPCLSVLSPPFGLAPTEGLVSGLVATVTQPKVYTTDLSTAHSARKSLSSPYLRKSVALCIVDMGSMGLDCNQHALELLHAPNASSLDVSWAESGLLCDPELGSVAAQYLCTHQASTISLLEEMRRFDGTFVWMRTAIVRMDDNGDISDPASMACSFQPTLLVVSQPTSAPLDGRGRVWADTTLLHMSNASLPRSLSL